MATDLTVMIEDSVVARAEEYARQRQTSVSRLVSDYLEYLADRQPASVLDGLTGMFHDNGKDYKSQLADALAEKYLT
jgi:hypothetical protein